MKFDTGTWWIVLVIAGAVTSALTYLIKTSIFARLDKLEAKLATVLESQVHKEDHENTIKEFKSDIETIKSAYITKTQHWKDYDECRGEIKQIKESYIVKEDFIREFGRLDQKTDKILDILLKLHISSEAGRE